MLPPGDPATDCTCIESAISIYVRSGSGKLKPRPLRCHATLRRMPTHCKTPDFLKNSNIAIIEMYNILIATRLWANTRKNKTIEIFYDNLAVVNVLNSGKTKDMYLAAISRDIFITAATSDIYSKFLMFRAFKIL